MLDNNHLHTYLSEVCYSSWISILDALIFESRHSDVGKCPSKKSEKGSSLPPAIYLIIWKVGLDYEIHDNAESCGYLV